tara:strand:- start:706 stop:939 length:234 start_codon:yes stop_codon:yes gene_type:complete
MGLLFYLLVFFGFMLLAPLQKAVSCFEKLGWGLALQAKIWFGLFPNSEKSGSGFFPTRKNRVGGSMQLGVPRFESEI